VSQKVEEKCEKTISKGKYYKLQLIEKDTPLLMNYIDIQCYSFNDSTIICIEPKKGVFDLYYCSNLEGLCIKNND
jgi:hypothetical protein